MAGKYIPLENYLRDLPANQIEVALSFEQIEGIINAPFSDKALNRELAAWNATVHYMRVPQK